MTKEEFQLIPVSGRFLQYRETKNLDIIYHTLERVTGIRSSKIRSLRLEPSTVKDYFYLIGAPLLVLEVVEALHNLDVDALEVYNNNPSESFARIPMQLFFLKSY